MRSLLFLLFIVLCIQDACATISPISGLTICELVQESLTLGADPEEIKILLRGNPEGLECLKEATNQEK